MSTVIHSCRPEPGWNGILEALAQAQAGDEVHISAGDYEGTSSLVVPTGVALVGIGDVSLCVRTASPTVVVTGASARVAHVRFVACTADQDLLVVDQADDVQVAGCHFDGRGLAGSAITVRRSRRVQIRDCAVRECSTENLSGRASIRLFSSQGVLYGNTIDGGRHGIAMYRADDAQGTPSNVHLVGNRCYDNQQAGIAFFSSLGRAEANECWGSRESFGITVERHMFSGAPPDVHLVGNRCHDNHQAGIAFFSSLGRAEANECWGSIVGFGITVQGDQDSPNAPSHVQLVGNRCHDNHQSGIAFFSSLGRAEANACWGNGTNDAYLEGTPQPSVHDHRSHALPLSDDIWREQVAGMALRRWLEQKQGGLEPAIAMADVLTSGGCPHCLERYWTARHPQVPRRQTVVQSSTAVRPATPSTAIKDHARGFYRVHPPAAGDKGNAPVQIRGVPAQALMTSPSGWPSDAAAGPSALSILFAQFEKRARHHLERKRRRDARRAQAPKWLAAWVSADQPGLDTWLEVRQAATRSTSRKRAGSDWRVSTRLTVCDLAGHAFDRPGRSFVAEGILHGKSRWQRYMAGLSACVFAPVVPALISLAMMAIAAAVTLGVVAHWQGSSLLSLLTTPHALGAATADVLAGALGTWASRPLRFTLAMFAWLIFGLFLPLNRLLPHGLAWTASEISRILDWLTEIPVLRKLANQGSQNSSAGGLSRLIHAALRSEACHRHWVARQIYGLRLRDRLLRKAPAALVVIRNVDVPTPAQVEELRTILSLCPRDQSVLVVTQMPGLSMLVSGFLDVWFQPGVQCPAADESWIVHDPHSVLIKPRLDRSSGTVPTGPKVSYSFAASSGYQVAGQPVHLALGASVLAPLGVSAPKTQDEHAREQKKNAATMALGLLLGWQPPAHLQGQGPPNEWIQTVNQVLTQRVGSTELLLSIVLGSTPQAHMALGRPNERHYHGLRARVQEHFRVLGCDSETDLDRVLDELKKDDPDKCVEAATGLLFVLLHLKRDCQWVGRAGYRVQAADAIRALFDSDRPDLRDAEAYLCRLLACGEFHHLRTARAWMATLRRTPSNPSLTTHVDLALYAQRTVLHLEAACSLACERLALHDGLRIPEALQDEWRTTVRRLRRTTPLSGSTLVRAWSAVLRAKHAYVSSAVTSGTTHSGSSSNPWHDQVAEEQLHEVVRDPAVHIGLDGTGSWDRFLRECQDFLNLLYRRDEATAASLLEAKLAQDWFTVPTSLKERFRESLRASASSWLKRLEAAHSSEQLMGLVMGLRERPALVIGALATLASTDARHRSLPHLTEPADLFGELAMVADPLLAMGDAAGTNATAPQHGVWNPSPRQPGPQAATALLRDPHAVDQLIQALKDGGKTTARLAEATAHTEVALEGVALGVHGRLQGVLNMARDADEVVLGHVSASGG